jgi:hypothetical protein
MLDEMDSHVNKELTIALARVLKVKPAVFAKAFGEGEQNHKYMEEVAHSMRDGMLSKIKSAAKKK